MADKTPIPELAELADAIKTVDASLTRERDPLPPSGSPSDPSADLAKFHPPDSEHAEPWTRQADETEVAWERFLYYRNLGPGRRMREVWEGMGVGQKSIEKHASRFDWVARARAFDRHEDRLYQLRRQHRLREMADEHSERIAEALAALRLPYQALLKRLEDDPDLISDMSKKDVKVLMNMAAQSARTMPNLLAAERLAQGMPTEIVEHTGEVVHTHVPDADAIAEIVATLSRVGAFDGRGSIGLPPEIVEGEVVGVHPGGGEGAAPETDSVSPS